MTPSDYTSHEESQRSSIGLFKTSKVGNNWKVSIPKFVADTWDLAGENSEQHDDFESNEVFLYGIQVEGKSCILISKEPLSGDPVLLFRGRGKIQDR